MVNSKFKVPNALQLIKSLKNVRSEWKLKTPMQKWCYLYGIAKAALHFIRMPLLNDLNHVHCIGYFTFVYLIGIPSLSLYTLCYYAYQGQLQVGLSSTCLAFICIGVSRIEIPFTETATDSVSHLKILLLHRLQFYNSIFHLHFEMYKKSFFSKIFILNRFFAQSFLAHTNGCGNAFQ